MLENHTEYFGAVLDTCSSVQRVDRGKKSGLQVPNLYLGVRDVGCEVLAHPFTTSAKQSPRFKCLQSTGHEISTAKGRSEVVAKRGGSISMKIVLINQFS